MAIKTKWSEKDLDYFQKHILEKRRKLLEEMGDLRENTHIANESASTSDSTYAYHMADVGTDQAEREKAYYWLARENNYLRYLDRALQMIEEGMFGICQTCGDLISKERLEEVPHTTSCFSCKTNVSKAAN
ncbi:MAG: TraR/DksA family transcriptional regulator [Calditrichaeota bacterium]|nr:TraR/DksA family transcriptional regulator [Calditrichota bacterium]